MRWSRCWVSSRGRRLLDFEDGELKTFRCLSDGDPCETIAIHQIGAEIDELLRLPAYENTSIYRKLRRLLLVGIWKEADDPARWKIAAILPVVTEEGSFWFPFLRSSYQDLMKQLVDRVNDGLGFETINAAYMQIRVRDSRPYTPLWSELAQRYIADKKIGFYLQRRFIRECLEEAVACGEGW